MSRVPRFFTVVAAGLVLVLVGCTSTQAPTATTPTTPNTSTAQPSSTEQSSPVAVQRPVKPEDNPPGDIPDNQAFVPYVAGGLITVTVPEGWSRKVGPNNVEFTDKLNTIRLVWTQATSAPTVAGVRSVDMPKLASSELAFRLRSVKAVTLPAGPAVLADYQVNSAANEVTGKQYRLDVLRFTIFKSGKRLDLTLLSPVGADNVDPWRVVSESLKWK